MIGIHKLFPDVPDPQQETAKSVGYDLRTYYKTETGRPNKLLIPPRSVRAVPTGLILAPPEGYSIFICSRAGMALSRSLFVINSPGIIDPDDRGEIFVMLYNGGHEAQYIQHGERVGQMILLPWKPFSFYTLKQPEQLRENVQ